MAEKIQWATQSMEHTCLAFEGKVGCNTIEYTTAFLYSDWLYFLWHGINEHIQKNETEKNSQLLNDLRGQLHMSTHIFSYQFYYTLNNYEFFQSNALSQIPSPFWEYVNNLYLNDVLMSS